MLLVSGHGVESYGQLQRTALTFASMTCGERRSAAWTCERRS